MPECKYVQQLRLETINGPIILTLRPLVIEGSNYNFDQKKNVFHWSQSLQIESLVYPELPESARACAIELNHLILKLLAEYGSEAALQCPALKFVDKAEHIISSYAGRQIDKYGAVVDKAKAIDFASVLNIINMSLDYCEDIQDKKDMPEYQQIAALAAEVQKLKGE